MIIPQVSKQSQATAPADLLTSQQAADGGARRSSSFDNMLQQRFTAPDRPAAPTEIRRPETRPAEPTRAESQRHAERSNRGATQASPSQSESTGGRGAAETAGTAQAPTETAKAAADQGDGTTTEEAATAETAETGPASLAVLSSIIAALSGALPPEGKGSDEALDDMLLSDPKRKTPTIAGEATDTQGELPEADTAESLLPKLLAGGDEGDAAKTRPAAGETKALVGPAAATQTPALAQVSGAAAAPGAMQGELTAGALNVSGGVGPHRTENHGVQQLPVYTPAGHKAWAEDVGNRLIWMANRSESRAELMLTPPSLGKLGVSIQVNGDQTTAQFVAATPAAREALEQAMPKLRELLQQAGINLGQADVSTAGDQQAREGGGRDGGDASSGRGGGLPGLAGTEAERVVQTGWTSGGNGVIDIFA